MLGIIANYVTYCVGMIIFFLLLSFFVFSIGGKNIIGITHSSILYLILRRFDSVIVIKINIIIATVFSVPLPSFEWRHFPSLRVLLRGVVLSYKVPTYQHSNQLDHEELFSSRNCEDHGNVRPRRN